MARAAGFTSEHNSAATGPRSKPEPDDIHAIELPHNRPLSQRERLVDLAFLAFALATASLWAFSSLP